VRLFDGLDPRGLEEGEPYRGKDIARYPSREHARAARVVDDGGVLGIILDTALKAETLHDAALRYLNSVESVAVMGVKGRPPSDPFRAKVHRDLRRIVTEMWTDRIKPLLKHLPDGSEVELRRGQCRPWDFVLHVISGKWTGMTFVVDAHTSQHGDMSLANYRPFVANWAQHGQLTTCGLYARAVRRTKRRTVQRHVDHPDLDHDHVDFDGVLGQCSHYRMRCRTVANW
jgi:hypothetical protein